jgi:imidazolonepropionase-like amidohydrolase
MRTLLFLSLVLLALPALFSRTWAQEPKPQRGPFAIVDAAVETVANGRVERATVLVGADGRIEGLGAGLAVPTGYTRIDGTGLTVYPGLIDGGTRLGLQEVGSLAETRDYRDVGEFTPHMEALTAINPSSSLLPINRAQGVTTVLAVPSGGTMPGTAALVHLLGYTPEQMAAGFRGVVLSWPSTARRGSWDRREREDIDKSAKEELDKLNEVWEDAALYARIDSAHAADPSANRAPEYAPELAAIAEALTGRLPLMIDVDAARDIEAALEWLDGQPRVRPILTGVAEGWRVADKIAAAGIPVVTGPVLALPTRESDRYDKPYQNAGLLHQAGVKVALQTNEVENVRNLSFHAGFAAAYGEAYGFGRKEALRAVTLAPAEIFGLGAETGSVEVGKRADLVIADGDLFEPQTQVRHLLIGGWLVPTENRQSRLYDEYLDRSPGLTGPTEGE